MNDSPSINVAKRVLKTSPDCTQKISNVLPTGTLNVRLVMSIRQEEVESLSVWYFRRCWREQTWTCPPSRPRISTRSDQGREGTRPVGNRIPAISSVYMAACAHQTDAFHLRGCGICAAGSIRSLASWLRSSRPGHRPTCIRRRLESSHRTRYRDHRLTAMLP